jgi:hypothetical protein
MLDTKLIMKVNVYVEGNKKLQQITNIKKAEIPQTSQDL